MRVLIVEDEAKMAGLIRKGLRQEGMAADVADKGEDALWMAGSTEYDAIVLDLMLPGIDGFEVCRRLRDDGVWSPILMLTARDGVPRPRRRPRRGRRRLPGQALLLRRAARPPARAGQAGQRASARRSCRSATCASTRPSARSGGATTEIELSAKEFAVLEVFMRRPGEVLSRFQLLEHAWDYEYENRSNIVDSYVRLLRQKIDKPFGVESIETVRGAGYRLREDGGAMSRIPIRLRVTLAFTIVMAVAAGRARLLRLLALRDRAQRADRPEPAHPRRRHRLAGRRTGPEQDPCRLLGREESFAQVLTPGRRGSTRRTPQLGDHPQLTPGRGGAGRPGARSSSTRSARPQHPGRGAAAGAPGVDGRGRTFVVVVGRLARRPQRVAARTCGRSC